MDRCPREAFYDVFFEKLALRDGIGVGCSC